MSANKPTSPPRLPSDAELKILRELWIHGESTVREIHDRAASEWRVGYTTVLKLLQRMLEKGLVKRREEGRAHVYRAAASEERTRQRLARDLVSRAFGGSIRGLVEAALPAGRARADEIEEIRKMLRRLEE
jgi:predicted transcriptional regulator